MTRHIRYIIIASLFVSLGFSCGDNDDSELSPTGLMDPVALDDHLVYLDQDNDRAYLLDVTSEKAAPRLVEADPIPANLQLTQRRNGEDNNELLILCSGQEDTEDEEEQPAALAVLQADGTVRNYLLQSAFNGMVQSDDGKYAFIFFDENVQSHGDDEQMAFFRNQAVIVDLDETPPQDEAIESRVLHSFGNTPRGVYFSPEMKVAGSLRRLAVILFDSHVSLLDMSHLDRPEITFEPRPGEEPMLSQVIFGPDDGRIYLRGTASDDIYVLDTIKKLDPDGGNDFEVKDTAHAAGNHPGDMVLYQDQERSRLLVVSEYDREAIVIEPDSGIDPEASIEDRSSWPARIPLPDGANRILFFETTSPRDDEVGPRALFFEEGTDNYQLNFLDLSEVEEDLEDNLESIQLEHPFRSVLAWDEGQVLLIHSDQGLSLLDLAQRSVYSVETQYGLELIPDPEIHKIWLAPTGNTKRLGYIDIHTSEDGLIMLDDGNVRLDETIVDFISVTTGDRKRVVAIHDSSLGYITILDALEPERETAVSLLGFLVADLLDKDE